MDKTAKPHPQTTDARQQRLVDHFARAAARPTVWQRQSFDRWRKSQSPQRLGADTRRLKTLYAAAEQSVTARAALAWARAHDIEIIVDHTTTAMGYYQKGTGVVAIGMTAFNQPGGLAMAVGTLAHEIRHAWQDHHGLLRWEGHGWARRSALATDIMRQALYEADASAHGELARHECRYGAHIYTARGYKRELRQHFVLWFNRYAEFYADSQCQYQASLLGVPGAVRPNYRTEFSAAVTGQREGLDPFRAEDLDRLGRSFVGVNYLAGAEKLDIFARKIMVPGRACGGYQGGTHPLYNAVRKQQMKEQLRRRPRRQKMPLPGVARGAAA